MIRAVETLGEWLEKTLLGVSSVSDWFCLYRKHDFMISRLADDGNPYLILVVEEVWAQSTGEGIVDSDLVFRLAGIGAGKGVESNETLAEGVKISVEYDDIDSFNLLDAGACVFGKVDRVRHDHQVAEPRDVQAANGDNRHFGRGKDGLNGEAVFDDHLNVNELICLEQDLLRLLVDLLVGEQDVGRNLAAHGVKTNCTPGLNVVNSNLLPAAKHSMVNVVTDLPREVQKSEGLDGGHVDCHDGCTSCECYVTLAFVVGGRSKTKDAGPDLGIANRYCKSGCIHLVKNITCTPCNRYRYREYLAALQL